MINLKYALEFDGFVQDVKDKRNLNIKFNGKEELFATYSIKDYRWHLADSVPKYELFIDTVNNQTSFSGCSTIAGDLIETVVIIDELKTIYEIVSDLIESLKNDSRTCSVIKSEVGTSLVLLLDKLEVLALRQPKSFSLTGLMPLLEKIKSINNLLNQDFFSDFCINTLV